MHHVSLINHILFQTRNGLASYSLSTRPIITIYIDCLPINYLLYLLLSVQLFPLFTSMLHREISHLTYSFNSMSGLLLHEIEIHRKEKRQKGRGKREEPIHLLKHDIFLYHQIKAENTRAGKCYKLMSPPLRRKDPENYRGSQSQFSITLSYYQM